MKLYDYEKAPNPRRVRIFLAEKGITVPRVQVDIVTGENLTPSFLAINPRGVLPVLELDDGTLIDESIAICRYFEELQPDPPLFGTDPKSKAVIESWQRHIEFDGLAQIADAYRNSSPLFAQRVLPGNVGRVDAIPALVERGKAGTLRFFKRLDDRLAASEYIAGNRYSVADITALVACGFARWIKVSIPEDHVHLLRWHALVSARPSSSA
jgi:glutathione S-transferase